MKFLWEYNEPADTGKSGVSRTRNYFTFILFFPILTQSASALSTIVSVRVPEFFRFKDSEKRVL